MGQELWQISMYMSSFSTPFQWRLVLSLALIQLAQIIGEAANRVSKPRRRRHPEILWAQIIGLRNRLVHGYDTINFDLLWQILTVDLPELITKLEKIVPPENM